MNAAAVAEEPIYSEPLDTISIASSVTEYSEPWQDPDVLIGEALENEFGTSDTQRQYEPSAPPLSEFSSLEELNITASNTLGAEEEKAIAILDEVLDDSSGYSSGYSRASSSLSDWSDASSLPSNDGYDTVYTSSSSEYSNDSSDEYDTPLPLLKVEEELAELDECAEVSNPEQTLVTPTDVKSSEFQEDGITASDFETLDHVNEEGSIANNSCYAVKVARSVKLI